MIADDDISQLVLSCFLKKKIKDVSREFYEFRVNTHILKLLAGACT